MMKRAYKYRIYLNKTQGQKLANAFGCTRFVWNKAVSAFNEKQDIPDLLALKAEFTFLNDRPRKRFDFLAPIHIFNLKVAFTT